ncbi:hypothetical protein GCK72_006176 [Caenorhabditis remanei]|uniref:Uncharacterized protein n=1 Tax=Caenorhabditis remanei TaxID=31234 RepID=A0A6A5HEJ4_CAERE|nr:hypothetical protein GCK72_006176 [Caenorhabditis remanei]KAF1766220.1 hypothetical protein GCK72_006176 [Caenorhabditis remanei]
MWRSYKAETPDFSDETQEVDINVSESDESDHESRSLSPCILINSLIIEPTVRRLSDINIRRSGSKSDITVQRDEFYDLASDEDHNELRIPGRKSRSASVNSNNSHSNDVTLQVPITKSAATSPTPSAGSIYFKIVEGIEKLYYFHNRMNLPFNYTARRIGCK